MTATQVFFRFIENEYRGKDGTVNGKMVALWRRELRTNDISSKISKTKAPIPLRTIFKTVSYAPVRERRSKNFVDDYLNGTTADDIGEHYHDYSLKYRRRTLAGFIKHFINFSRYLSYASLYGGWSHSENKRRITNHWHRFLDEHIVEGQKRYVKYGEKVNYEWKD